MSDLLVKRLAAVVALCLLAVVAAGSVLGARSVAADLNDRSETVLESAGLADVRVEFTGREASLSGGNDVEARLATSLVTAMPGVRQVDDSRVHQDDLRGVARFEVDRAGDDVEISGTVPSPDEAAAIKVAVAATLRVTVTGDVEVDPSLPAAAWTDQLPAVLDIVAGVEGLEIEIRGDGTVALGGLLPDAAVRERVVEQVAASLPGLDLVETLRLAAAPREGR